MVLVVIVGTFGNADAHPGGLDRYGCHRDSSTGTRHCHGDGESGEKLNAVPTAEVGVELGGRKWLRNGADVTYFGAWRVQHDGSMLFLAGLGTSGRLGMSRVGGYLDIGFGAAWITRQQTFFVFRAAAGLRFPLLRLGSIQRQAYFKAGLFIEGIVDGFNAEPAGVDAALHVAL